VPPKVNLSSSWRPSNKFSHSPQGSLSATKTTNSGTIIPIVMFILLTVLKKLVKVTIESQCKTCDFSFHNLLLWLNDRLDCFTAERLPFV